MKDEKGSVVINFTYDKTGVQLEYKINGISVTQVGMKPEAALEVGEAIVARARHLIDERKNVKETQS
jgi:hypothetical protein